LNGGHFEYIIIVNILYCIVIKTKGLCKILAQSVEINSSAILESRHIGFIMTSTPLAFSTRQALLFGVAKKRVIRHFETAAILNV
jgi:hypothetical protein